MSCQVSIAASNLLNWSRISSTRTPLVDAIFDIIGLSTKEKVRGINTSRIVAGVKDAHSSWDWAERFDPSKSMGFIHFAHPHERTVAIALKGSGPNPATFGLSDTFPERFPRSESSPMAMDKPIRSSSRSIFSPVVVAANLRRFATAAFAEFDHKVNLYEAPKPVKEKIL